MVDSPRQTTRNLILPAILILAFWGLTGSSTVREHTSLKSALFFLAAGFFIGFLGLTLHGALTGAPRRIEFVPVRSHYVQACVQFCILAYWGWFAREVVLQAPMIFAQILFVYLLDGLLNWSRGRAWRVGFGPIPIVFSTNLLLWFKVEVFYYQFLMLALGVMGKHFVTWKRDDRRVHIFNPSAFGQFVVALVLIATGTTNELTWGKQIAASFETPHMLVVIFIAGIVVQALFRVTLMTVAAAMTLCLINWLYTAWFGTYFFVNVNVAAPIFLGLHLLITDPATSPRTNVGQVLFGAVYALSYSVLFRVLDDYEIPTFWDKLLPVPLLNLMVPLLDRLARTGVLGSLNRAWQSTLTPLRLNAVHMTAWSAFFAALWLTGFIDAVHPGNSIPFWQKALAENKPFAGNSLVMAVGAQAEAEHSGAAFNELGLICLEGRLVSKNHSAAARYFSRACELGDLNGCANVAGQYLFLHERRSDEDVARAFDTLERACRSDANWKGCLLTGIAYETGRGRPKDAIRALASFERCGRSNLYACKGIARLALAGATQPEDLPHVVQMLRAASDTGDAESTWYLAFMYHAGLGVPRNEMLARACLETACKLGTTEACAANGLSAFPTFTRPRMLVPEWSTAFPIRSP